MKEKQFLRRFRKEKNNRKQDAGLTEPFIPSGSVRPTDESGPLIYPGMEDRGIGSVIMDYDGFDDFDENDDELDEDEIIPADASLSEEAEEEEPLNTESETEKRIRRKNGPFRFISYATIILFFLLMAHLIYFNIREKDAVLNSPYNRRQNSQADRVIRGDIRSIDGSTLARTETDDEGNEIREYPYSNIFAHTVGFVTHGKSGLESVANYQLLTAHNNIIDQIINEFLKKKNPGDTVVTTLNAGIQESSYYALGDYRGAVIVMNPATGAVRAMVSKPDFDPNTLAWVWDEMVSDSSNSQLLNRAVQGLYPPGSTFKIVTSLSYYRKYNTFSNYHYNCTGEFEVDDTVVHCYNGTAHGEEDFASAFAHSCNTAFSEIGLMLGSGSLSSTASDLMFGERMPGELNQSRTRWQLSSSSDDIELVQTAFGQGKTLTTPMHMALICSAVANHGVVMNPYLIDHVENRSGDVISRVKPSRYKRIMTEEEAEQLKKLMVGVVEEGTASALLGNGYKAAGKTGSAEYVKSDGTIGTHSWFVGFTNPDDPELVIVVLAENGGAGSSTAVPIAEEILNSIYSN